LKDISEGVQIRQGQARGNISKGLTRDEADRISIGALIKIPKRKILRARSRAALKMDIKSEGMKVDLLGKRQIRSHTLNLRDQKAGNPWYLLHNQSSESLIKG
jgi:hypothetical protein